MAWFYRTDQEYALKRDFVEVDENGPIPAQAQMVVITKKESGNFPLETPTADNVVLTVLNATNIEHQLPAGGGPPKVLAGGQMITFLSYGGKWYSEF